MAHFRTSRTFDILFVMSLLGLLGWGYIQRIAVNDWLFFASHKPSTKAILTAGRAGLSETGRRLLYRTDPQFASAQTVTNQCDAEQLGCLTARGQAFILDDPARPAQTTVTATHEMLHLAYRRLSADDKAILAPLLDEAIDQNATKLTEELRGQTTLSDRRDEAHSLLGSEYAHLPAKLEQYYTSYFHDRSQVVKAEAASRREP